MAVKSPAAPRAVVAAVLLLFVAAAAPIAAAQPPAREPVWIDTDPACGRSGTDDVDDCWALLLALRSPRLAVRGVSTVFGNAGGAVTYRTGRAALARFADSRPAVAPALHRGAYRPLRPRAAPLLSPAVEALASALRRERLTVLALGPLTNVAVLLTVHPELAGRMRRIVAVAGQRPGERVFFAGWNPVLHLHDMNFDKDPEAFRVVLHAGVPLVLVPFEAASKVVVTQRHLARLAAGNGAARWLAGASAGWMSFWRTWLGADGFYPFDALAVAHVLAPHRFVCERWRARVRVRSFLGHVYGAQLAVAKGFPRGAPVTYCRGADPALGDWMVSALLRRRAREKTTW